MKQDKNITSKEALKAKLLSDPIDHIDFTSFDARPLIDDMGKMSFTSRDTARAAEIFNMMLADEDASIILTLAGSTSAGGLMQLYADLVKHNMVDCVVATGASIIDMDFFEALGFRHYRGDAHMDDAILRELSIDRIYDTYIDEEDLQACDKKIAQIADDMPPGIYSSCEFIAHLGAWLQEHAVKKGSLIETCTAHNVPVFCPAFSDSSAGFGLVMHQERNKDKYVSIDSVRDFRQLTQVKINAGTTGLMMVGGGVPKNFAQDTVVCAELLGHEVPMHKYAVQITVADVRDGACSSSTLKEASSWGKVDTVYEQMVYAEATTTMPLLASNAYHKGAGKGRKRRSHLKKILAP